MDKLIITNGKIVLNDLIFEGAIEIADGKIQKITDDISSSNDATIVDANGQLILPGMIDTHVHINEPGRTDWEGFETGSKALAAGGTTTYIDMPLNALPATTTKQYLHEKMLIAKEKSYVDYGFYGALTPDNLDYLEELAEGGVVGFKCFLSTYKAEVPKDFKSVDDYTLLEGMKKIAALNKILLIHCENADITDRFADEKIKHGKLSTYDFVDSRPIIAEVEAVSRVILFATYTKCPVHIVHISSSEALDLIEKAKKDGVDITVESCPHYFALDAHDLNRIGNIAKCQPPLRYPEEQKKLWKYLLDGKIDWISSDHSPCTIEEKQGTIFEALGGITSCQNNVDLMFDLAVKQHHMSIFQFVKMIATNPAERFHLKNKGQIAVGFDADLIFINPNQSYTVQQKDLYYKNPHSPYIGRKIHARVTKTFLRGNVIFSLQDGLTKQPLGNSVSSSFVSQMQL